MYDVVKCDFMILFYVIFFSFTLHSNHRDRGNKISPTGLVRTATTRMSIVINIATTTCRCILLNLEDRYCRMFCD